MQCFDTKLHFVPIFIKNTTGDSAFILTDFKILEECLICMNTVRSNVKQSEWIRVGNTVPEDLIVPSVTRHLRNCTIRLSSSSLLASKELNALEEIFALSTTTLTSNQKQKKSKKISMMILMKLRKWRKLNLKLHRKKRSRKWN